MRIKAISKLPRLITIPGKIGNKDYRALQAHKIIDIEETSAQFLIDHGYAEAAKEAPAKEVKKDG